MSKPWFGPLPPMFAVFPITWQGWTVVVGSQVAIVLIRVFGPSFFTDPDKGAREATGLAFLVEVAYAVVIIWKVGSRRRRDGSRVSD